VRDPNSLVDDDSMLPSSKLSKPDKSMLRIQGLYYKITCILRWTVRTIFATRTDVLEAGSEIQQTIDAIMKGRQSLASYGAEGTFLDGFTLDSAAGEKIQVHIDCMNAIGQVVSIDDVDDMGGQCFVYLRVAILNIHGSTPIGSVAVGDTFSFSPGLANLYSSSYSTDIPKQNAARLNLYEDYSCLSTSIPYFRTFLGAGIEERTAQHLTANIRNVHMLPTLGLGGTIDYLEGARSSLYMLVDNAMTAPAHAEIKSFSSGFIVDRVDVRGLPILVSFPIHVQEVWVCDLADVHKQVVDLYDPENLCPDAKYSFPNAVLMVMKLKHADDQYASLKSGGTYAPEVCHNPLGILSSPDSSETQHIAFVIHTSTGGADGMTGVLGVWRNAMRLHDIKENRGTSAAKLPTSILKSFSDSLGFWSSSRLHPFPANSQAGSGVRGMGATKMEMDSDGIYSSLKTLGTSEMWNYACGGGLGLCNPGSGYLPLLSAFSIAETRRLILNAAAQDEDADDEALLHAATSKAGDTKISAVIVSGHAGSGLISVATQMGQRLGKFKEGRQTGLINVHATPFILDMSGGITSSLKGDSDVDRAESKGSSIFGFGAKSEGKDSKDDQDASRSSTSIISEVRKSLSSIVTKVGEKSKSSASSVQVIVIGVVLSPVNRIEFTSVLNLLTNAGITVSSAIAIVNAKSALNSNALLSDAIVASSLGPEIWQSSAFEVCHKGMCDVVVVVDEDNKHATHGASAYSKVVEYIEVSNPSLRGQIHHVSGGNVWLDQDLLDLVVKNVQSGLHNTQSVEAKRFSDSKDSDAIAARKIRTGEHIASATATVSTRISCKHEHSVIRALNRLNITPPHGASASASASEELCYWDPHLLIKAAQFLFPEAVVNANCITDTWQVPPKRGGVWQRAIDLALCKVVSKMRVKNGIVNQKKYLSSQNRTDLGILSLHGVIKVNLGGMSLFADDTEVKSSRVKQSTVSFEASAGAIVFRVCEAISGVNCDTISVHGVFSESQKKSIRSIFNTCTLFTLPRQALLKDEDLTHEKICELQRIPENMAVDLPHGWWFDGSCYIDVNGTRNPLRPDVRWIKDKYLDGQNRSINMRNSLLDKAETISSLL